MDLARLHRCEALSRRIGPAGAVADVTHGGYVCPGGWIENGLAAFAGERSRAALGDEIHGAGVEIDAKGRNCARARWADNAGAARRGAAGVCRAVGIDPEGFVFFNDPAIIG